MSDIINKNDSHTYHITQELVLDGMTTSEYAVRRYCYGFLCSPVGNVKGVIGSDISDYFANASQASVSLPCKKGVSIYEQHTYNSGVEWDSYLSGGLEDIAKELGV